MHLATLRNFEKEIRKTFPKFKLAYKDTSPLMKVLGFFWTPFNPKFMSRYALTVGSTVYFPSRSYYESYPKASFTLLAHELVHMTDEARFGIKYKLSYFFPQFLAPFALLVFLATTRQMHMWPLAILLGGFLLGCWAAKMSQAAFWIIMGAAVVATSSLLIYLTHWGSTAYFAALLFAAPWPSPWRARWERRAFVMNLAVVAWTIGPPPDIIRDLTVKHFTEAEYYFMVWSNKTTEDFFNKAIVRAKDGSLREEVVYARVYDFLSSNKLLRTSSS